MALDNKVLEDIKNYAIQRLNAAYGYCGVAEGESMAMLNSGIGSDEIRINIKQEKVDLE